MRHQVAGRRLGRPGDQRKALYRSLVRDVLLYERIRTTVAKAKEARGLVDRVIWVAIFVPFWLPVVVVVGWLARRRLGRWRERSGPATAP